MIISSVKNSAQTMQRLQELVGTIPAAQIIVINCILNVKD
jgi:hypothetical protein